MAGMGPPPKPAAARRRRNVAPGATTLRAIDGRKRIPKLPFEVTEPTAAWWKAIWTSPMAPEWDSSDIHGLHLLARLVDEAWKADSLSALKEAMTEIRLQSQRFGLSPLDRRRLQWEIDRGDEAEAKTRARKTATTPARARKDPRLKVV